MKPAPSEIITENALTTQKIGRVLAEEIIKSQPGRKNALVIGLEGELGSGKTTFIQGMAKGFGLKEPMTSPTFVIMRKYQIKKGANFYHIDCYRINRPKDLLDLDFKEMLSRPQNIIVIEWAERVKKILPLNTLWIKFEHLAKNKRRILYD